MFILILKALPLLIPFLKRALFGDKLIKEVLLENKHITLFFSIILLLCFILVFAVQDHESTKKENVALRIRTEERQMDMGELHSRKVELNALLK